MYIRPLADHLRFFVGPDLILCFTVEKEGIDP